MVVGALATLGLVLVGVHHWVLAAVGAEANGARILDRLDTVAGPGVMVLILLVGFGWTAAPVVRRPVVPALSASQPSQPSLA